MSDDRLQLGPALFEALQRSASFENTNLELIETHISWVILTPTDAWKIKKPVKFDFADFSTLELRKHFCEEELRLNRRLAPELYLGVVPITGSVESPEIAGAGEAIDYAVHMRRFPDDALLTHVIERGELQRDQIIDLAENVARFHQAEASVDPASGLGRSASIWQAVTENFRFLKEHLTDQRQRDLVNEVEIAANATWLKLQPVYEERRRNGFVRECHGDMHLGNMVLIDGRVTVFDGIDFNPNFRWIDVMQEVAFVVMDLRRRGHEELGSEFLNHYCELTGDYAGVQLLPFFVSYLALVRAKITEIEVEQHISEQPQSSASQQASRSANEVNDVHGQLMDLLKLGRDAIQPQRPMLMITHGFSGSGKSSVTSELIGQLGAIRIRSDVERKRPQTPKLSGVEMYSSTARSAVYDDLANKAGVILRAGQSVIVDATFLKESDRQLLQDVAREPQARFVIADFEAPIEILKQRIQKRQQRGSDASDADVDVLEQQLHHHDPLTEAELLYTIRVDATEEPQEAVRELFEKLQGLGDV